MAKSDAEQADETECPGTARQHHPPEMETSERML